MFVIKKSILVCAAMVLLNLNICNIWAMDCSEKIEDDPSQPPIIIPAHRVYYGFKSSNVEESKQYLKKNTITCKDVTLPFKHTKFAGNTLIISIKSMYNSTIPSAAFGNVTNISILDLNNLNITRIYPGAFGVNPLSKVNLSRNNLTEIGLGIFNSFAKLENLDLSYNGIKTLATHCFIGIAHLKMLNISVNQLTAFSFDVLDPNVVQIDYFNISFNKLSEFDLSNNINILHMWLNNNEIKQTKLCPLMFVSLYLNNNLLQNLPEGTCYNNVSRLTIFDVSFNKISEIKQINFQKASNLEYLFLNHNNISNISIGAFFDLHNLKTLNLSQNNLQHFRYGTFNGLHNLESLDLSYNNIKSTNMMLHALNNLKQLYLHNNDINSIDISKNSYLNLNLSKLSLHNNNFTCDNLINFFQNSNIHSILVYGPTKNSSNIHGIACSETENTELLPNKDFENLKSNIENVVTSLLKETNGKNHNEKDIIKDYYDNGFKNSNFYKFMSNFNEPNSMKFNERDIIKYFNDDFENSKFYKYLEGLKDTKNFTEFKNLEGLKNSVNFKHLDTEKLVNIENFEDKTNVIGFTCMCILMIILCSLNGIIVYKIFYSKVSKTTEQVELIQT